MDQDRKHEILAAEADFANREKLSRALAENGVYVVGKLKTPARDAVIVRRRLPEQDAVEGE